MQRVFAVDALKCTKCGWSYRWIAAITRGRTRPAWVPEEAEVATREAILRALEAAD